MAITTISELKYILRQTQEEKKALIKVLKEMALYEYILKKHIRERKERNEAKKYKKIGKLISKMPLRSKE